MDDNTILKNLVLPEFSGSTALGSKKLIPNNFFQTYKTREVDPETYAKINDLRIKNPTFNFYFHDDLQMEKYMAANWQHRKIFEIYKNISIGAAKADIWRYCILYQYGGVYLDFDSSISFALDALPDDANEIISFESNKLISIISEKYTPDYLFLSNIIEN